MASYSPIRTPVLSAASEHRTATDWPRKLIFLIQAVEKTINDLLKLESVSAMNSPLLLKCMESKIAGQYDEGLANSYGQSKKFSCTWQSLYCTSCILKKQEDILEKLEKHDMQWKFVTELHGACYLPNESMNK